MKSVKSIALFLAIVSLEIVSIFTPAFTQAANLTLTKDTLQSSRISWAGRVKSPTIAGSAHVWIYTAASAPYNSISTANLAPGDALTIGTGSYTVESIVDADEFTLTANLATGDADDTDPIYFAAKPQHVITFTTASAVSNGFFQVLLPADATTPNDGKPDDGGFDFGAGSITLTPTDASGYVFISAYNAATASGDTGCTAPANYHCFEFHYSGTGGNGVAITLTIGNTTGATTPIAPAPAAAHVGTADSYKVIVKNFTPGANPNTATPTDQTSTSIALIESVRVTATVDPTISFTITGVASGQTVCGTGSTTDIDTTAGLNAPASVPFGTMSLNTFKTAAHLLTISTNATNGYTITAVEDDQLGIGGGTTPAIIDTACDSGPCTHLAEQSWETASGHPGFGYSLGAGTGATMAFSNANTFKTKQFAAAVETEAPQTIMSSTGVSDSHTGYICYRLSVNATQAAGDYENLITYTATSSF